VCVCVCVCATTLLDLGDTSKNKQVKQYK